MDTCAEGLAAARVAAIFHPSNVVTKKGQRCMHADILLRTRATTIGVSRMRRSISSGRRPLSSRKRRFASGCSCTMREDARKLRACSRSAVRSPLLTVVPSGTSGCTRGGGGTSFEPDVAALVWAFWEEEEPALPSAASLAIVVKRCRGCRRRRRRRRLSLSGIREMHVIQRRGKAESASDSSGA